MYCDRIIGLEIDTDNFSILVLCVYLPFDSSENYDDFMFYLANLTDCGRISVAICLCMW